jgi:hypothetical protein
MLYRRFGQPNFVQNQHVIDDGKRFRIDLQFAQEIVVVLASPVSAEM